MKDIRIWDNGKQATVVTTFDDHGFTKFEDLAGYDIPLHVCSCFLRDYDLSFGNESFNPGDLLGYFLRNYEIEKSTWHPCRDYYYDRNNEEIKVEDREYSTKEIDDIIHSMYDYDELDIEDIIDFFSKTKFKDVIMYPFYAYIHSGIAISNGNFGDPWDSGLAGYYWLDVGEAKSYYSKDANFEEELENCFEMYKKYIEDDFIEFRVVNYEKDTNGKWSCSDDYFDTEFDYTCEVEDIWDSVDFKFNDIVEEIPDSLKSFIAENMSKEEVIDCLLSV